MPDRPTAPRALMAPLHLLLTGGGLFAPAAMAAEIAGSGGVSTLPGLLLAGGGVAAGLLASRLLGRKPAPPPAAPPPEQPAPPWLDFIELTGDWLWETDAEHRFVAIPGAPPAPSIAPADALGRDWEEVIMPDVPPDFAQAHRDTLARHGPIVVTLTRRSQSGELRYLELRGRPVFDASGHFQGYRGIGREVTDHARLSAELERNEERIHALIAYSTDGYWEQDANLRYTAITASSGHLADLAAEDAIGNRRWELPGESPDEAPWAEHIAQLKQIEPFSNLVFCRRDRNGRAIWLSESGIPVFDNRGVFAGYCGTTRNITAEVEARDQLQENEALFRALFAGAPACVGRISADGRWLEVNDALANLLGRSADAITGQPVDGFLEPEDAASGQTLRGRCLAGETRHFAREARYHRADGQTLWCRESARLIPGDDDTPPFFAVAIEDISALRNTLDTRRAGEERYRLLFELSPEATLVCINGRVHLTNEASRRLFGANDGRALDGVEILSLVHPDDRALEAARLEEFAASPQAILAPLPLRYQRLDGEPINAEATGVRIHFDGQPAMLYVMRDVARWLSAEQVLRESRAMYRDVVESVNEILFQTDTAGHVTFLNRAWGHTTGFDARLTIGQSLLDFVSEEDRIRVDQRLRGIREGYEDIAQFEFRLRTHSDGPRWVEATIRPLRNTYDHVVGSSGTLDDITARKEAEQSQRDLNRELEARAAGERRRRGLRGGVGQHAGAGHAGRVGADHDDGAAVAEPGAGAGRLQAVQHPGGVDVEVPLPGVLGGVGEARGLQDPRGAGERVEGPEPVGRRGERALDAVRGGDVGGERQGVRGTGVEGLVGDRGHAVGVPVEQRERGPGPGEAQGGGAADAGRGAGHQGDEHGRRHFGAPGRLGGTSKHAENIKAGLPYLNNPSARWASHPLSRAERLRLPIAATIHTVISI